MRIQSKRNKRLRLAGFFMFLMVVWFVVRSFGRCLVCKRQSFSHEDAIKQIFFIETDSRRDLFNLRQLCSIESAALHNPQVQVRVLSIKANFSERLGRLLFKAYSNLFSELLQIDEILDGTPLEGLPSRMHHDIEYFRVAQLSDLLRLAVVYKHSGMYLDLDTITIRSLEPLFAYSAFGINRSMKSIGNAFFVSKRKQDRFLFKVMLQVNQTYRANGNWTQIGGDPIKHVFANECGVDIQRFITKPGSSTESKCGFVLFPHYITAPIGWAYIEKAFRYNESLSPWEYQDTYSMHFNSFLTGMLDLSWNTSSIYGFFASLNCPIVFAAGASTNSTLAS
jgi:lactosylceramide 4-alpha-galactosyltransferase